MAFSSKFNYPTVVVFRGTPIALGLLYDGGDVSVGYQVMNNDSTWTDVATLRLPDMANDPSVAAWLGEHEQFSAIYDFAYQTASDTQKAAIRAISDDSYIYLFRVSKERDCLMVDRFVLNTESQVLSPNYEVRYVVSGQKYKPANDRDRLDYKKEDGAYFYEPTTILKTVVHPMPTVFGVQLVATATPEEWRWHVVTVNSGSSQLELHSFRKSSVHDFEGDPVEMSYIDGEGNVAKSEIPAYVSQTVASKSSWESGSAAQLYTIREDEENVPNRGQVVATDTRMMIALLATGGRVAIMDLQVGFDGNLCAIPGIVEFGELGTGEVPSSLDGSNGLTYAAYWLSSLNVLEIINAPSLLASGDGYVYCCVYTFDTDGAVRGQAFDTHRQYWANRGLPNTVRKGINLARAGIAGRTFSSSGNVPKNTNTSSATHGTNCQGTSWYSDSLVGMQMYAPFLIGECTSNKRTFLRPLTGDGDMLDKTTDTNSDAKWDAILPYTVNGRVSIFTPRSTSTKAETRQVNGGGKFSSVYQKDLGAYYRQFFTYEVNGNVYLVGLQNGGKLDIRQLLEDGTIGPLCNSGSAPSIGNATGQMVVYNVESRVFLLLHWTNSEWSGSGFFSIYELFDDGTNSKSATYKLTDKRYYQSLSVYQTGGKVYMLAYSYSDNSCISRELNPVGTMSENIKYEKLSGATSTTIFPYYTSGGAYLFLEDYSGDWSIRALNADGTWGEPTSSGSSSNVSKNLTWYIAGGATYLVRQRYDKKMYISRLDPDGTRSHSTYSHSWDNQYDMQTVIYLPVVNCRAIEMFEFGRLENVRDGNSEISWLVRGYVAQDAFLFGSIFDSEPVGNLVMEFIDHMQVDNCLVGFIEGPPPVPSANMKGDGSYDGLCGVQYSSAEKNTVSYASSRAMGINAIIDVRYGYAAGKLETSYSWLDEAKVDNSTYFSEQIQLPLSGSMVDGEFVPDNRGAALYCGVTARVYALRLKSDPTTLVGYSHGIISDPATPPQHQLVSFPINKDYRVNGDLETYYFPDLSVQLQTAINRAYLSRNAFYEQYSPNAFTAFNNDHEGEVITETSLMNSYSWDGKAGAFRSNEATFTGTVSESVGGNFKMLSMAGVSVGDSRSLFALNAMTGGHVNLTVSKSSEGSYTVSLTESFNPLGLAHGSGLTSGQVSNYSWVTFFLNSDVMNFDALFNEVVDQDWLKESGDANAVLMRKLLQSRNPVWRAGHIVTAYDVEE